MDSELDAAAARRHDDCDNARPISADDTSTRSDGVNAMRRIRTIGLSLLLLLVPLVMAEPAGAADGKLSTALLDTVNSLLPSDQVNVIVQTEGPPSLLLRTLVTTLGGVVGSNFTSINGFPARLSVSGIL